MITTLEKKFFPVVNGEYTRITAELLYNSNGKYYYISINPEKIERRANYSTVTVIPAECNAYKLQTVTRRTKKQDRLALADFSALAGVFVKKKAKSLGVELEVEA